MDRCKNKNWEEKRFIFIASVFITVLAFVPYIAQVLSGAVVTYFKSNDMHLAMYPVLTRIQKFFETGNFYGIDFTTFNGASDFFLRANMPGYYLFNWLIIPLSYLFSMRTAFAMFHMIHIFIYCIFSQKLCIKFFGLNRYLSLAVVSSYLWIVLFETWTTQFFLIAVFTLPLLYFSLMVLEDNQWIWYMIASLFYVFVFTCGYVTLSVALVAINVVVVLGYTHAAGRLDFKKIIKILIPPLLATIVCLGYYLQMLDYSNNVAKAETAIADAFFYKQGLKDLLKIISRNIVSVAGTEQTIIVTIGIVWFVILIACVKGRVFDKMGKLHKWCFGFGVCAYIMVWLISLCGSTAVGILFYSLVPVLGSMHIPMRYLIILMPYLFIALAIGMQYLPDKSGDVFYKKGAYVLAVLGLVYLVGSRYIDFSRLISSSDEFLLEIIASALVLAGFYYKGLRDNKILLLWSGIMIFYAVGNYYDSNEVAAPANRFEQRSITYNDNLIEWLDDYVGTLPEREVYKYIAYDSEENVPITIPCNYGWYNYSKYNLCNYIGYNVALAIPDDYKYVSGWFNVPDWEYVLSTRGDFIVLDQEALDDNMELFTEIIDWDKPVGGFDGTRMLFSLNKYLPLLYSDYINGENNGDSSRIKDEFNSLDNGYFYSPDLTNDNIIDFYCNEATRLQLSFEAKGDTRWSLLMYPNRYYKYYIDGEEINPMIYKKQAYFNVDGGGIHEIRVEYDNPGAKVIVIIFIGYYILCFVCCVVYIAMWLKKRVSNRKNI